METNEVTSSIRPREEAGTIRERRAWQEFQGTTVLEFVLLPEILYSSRGQPTCHSAFHHQEQQADSPVRGSRVC